MFPTLPNRLLAAAAIFLGAWAWISAAGALAAADGSKGFSLMAAHGGLVHALPALLLAAAPAIVLSVVCSSVGNPLCGLFTLTTALWVVAAQGNPIGDWVHRTDAKLPGDYAGLAIELFIWAAIFIGFIFLVYFARPLVRKALPFLARQPHLGEELKVTRGWIPSLVSAAIAAVIGGVLAYVLLRSPQKGQVIGALMLAFMVGGLAGDLITAFLFKKHSANPIGIILAPLVVGLFAYLLTAWGYRDSEAFLKAFFEAAGAPGARTNLNVARLSGLALALPIDYASAGIAGCALGVGWSQVMWSGENEEKPQPAPAPAAK